MKTNESLLEKLVNEYRGNESGNRTEYGTKPKRIGDIEIVRSWEEKDCIFSRRYELLASKPINTSR